MLCTARCRGGKKAFVGHVVMEELGQRTIFVLTVFSVSSSPPLSLVGYHVHPIYTVSRDSQSSVPSHLVLPKNNGLKKRPLKDSLGFFEVGLYDILIHSQGINYSRWQSAQPQFGEAAGTLV